MIINVDMGIGVMRITNTIKKINGTWIKIPLLKTKLMTIETDHQSLIKKIIGLYDFGLKCCHD